MTDFELQRRLRDLRVPVEPQRDLFPGIAARITAQPPAIAPTRRRAPWAYAAAAAIVVAVMTGIGIGSLDRLRAVDDSAMAVHPARLPGMKEAALARAPGGDPRLAGAAVVLDDARNQLEQAMAERPDAVFLVSLMNRTNAQRLKLERIGHDAG